MHSVAELTVSKDFYFGVTSTQVAQCTLTGTGKCQPRDRDWQRRIFGYDLFLVRESDRISQAVLMPVCVRKIPSRRNKNKTVDESTKQ